MIVPPTDTRNHPGWPALTPSSAAVLHEPDGRTIAFLVPEVDDFGTSSWRNEYATSGTLVEIVADSDDARVDPDLSLVRVVIRSGPHRGQVAEVLRKRVRPAAPPAEARGTPGTRPTPDVPSPGPVRAESPGVGAGIRCDAMRCDAMRRDVT